MIAQKPRINLGRRADCHSERRIFQHGLVSQFATIKNLSAMTDEANCVDGGEKEVHFGG